MTLHEELEEFLSAAKLAFVTTEEGIGMIVWFGKDQLYKFTDSYYYEMLIGFFIGRTITLVVYRNHPRHTFSFVDTNSGDCLNISKVRFTPSDPEEIFASIPTDSDIEFDIMGTSADNQYVLEPPESISMDLMMLKGYTII